MAVLSHNRGGRPRGGIGGRGGGRSLRPHDGAGFVRAGDGASLVENEPDRRVLFHAKKLLPSNSSAVYGRESPGCRGPSARSGQGTGRKYGGLILLGRVAVVGMWRDERGSGQARGWSWARRSWTKNPPRRVGPVVRVK